MIVSYGGHGGGKGAAQLRQVLEGVHMNAVDTMPALSFPSRKVLVQATKGEELDLIGENRIWASEEKDICQGFEQLVLSLKGQHEA